MPYNLLLLPLLGGYIFARKCFRTRYNALRSDNYKLIFLAAEFGLYLLVLSAILRFVFLLVAKHSSFLTFLANQWHVAFPYDYSGTALLAFFLGLILWTPANWWFGWTKDSEVDRAIDEKKDPLEVLLKDAMRSGRAILVTLDSGKVYVGQVTANFNPAYDVESIKILPILSGYRKQDDQSVIFKIDYTDLLTRIHNHDPTVSERDKKDLGIVIPLREVSSACIFSLPMYSKFFAPHSQRH